MTQLSFKYFATEELYDAQLALGTVSSADICFIGDTKKLITFNQEWLGYSPIVVSMTQFFGLVSTNKLIPGTNYVISDYAVINQFPLHGIILGSPEPIAVAALTTSSIEPDAFAFDGDVLKLFISNGKFICKERRNFGRGIKCDFDFKGTLRERFKIKVGDSYAPTNDGHKLWVDEELVYGDIIINNNDIPHSIAIVNKSGTPLNNADAKANYLTTLRFNVNDYVFCVLEQDVTHNLGITCDTSISALRYTFNRAELYPNGLINHSILAPNYSLDKVYEIEVSNYGNPDAYQSEELGSNNVFMTVDTFNCGAGSIVQGTKNLFEGFFAMNSVNAVGSIFGHNTYYNKFNKVVFSIVNNIQYSTGNLMTNAIVLGSIISCNWNFLGNYHVPSNIFKGSISHCDIKAMDNCFFKQTISDLVIDRLLNTSFIDATQVYSTGSKRIFIDNTDVNMLEFFDKSVHAWQYVSPTK